MALVYLTLTQYVVLEIFKSCQCIFAILLLFPIKEGSDHTLGQTGIPFLPKYPLFQVWFNWPRGSAEETFQRSSLYFHHFAFISTPIPTRNGCSLSRANLNPTVEIGLFNCRAMSFSIYFVIISHALKI